MKRLLASALMLLGLVCAASAQSVSVTGPVAPGDCTAFNSTTVLRSAGVACGGPAGVPLSLCNGVTDQTAYVQSALNTGSAFIPVGVTCLATHVVIPTNGIFQVAANACLKKFGSSNVVLVVAGGANVTLLGPGCIDMNSDPLGNVTFTGNTGTIVDGVHFKNGTLHDIYFQDVSSWTVKNSFFTNNAYFANIINYAIGADEADINILNNYCDRTGVPNPAPSGAGQCFYFVPQSHNVLRVRASNNTCIGPGVAQISPDEASCLIFLAEGMGTFWQFPEAIVTGNITRNFNFPYSLGGIQNGLAGNNTATGAGPQGYCYEIGGNKDSSWPGNSCDGLFTTGQPFILNNSTGVSVAGGTITHRATGAGAIAFEVISSGSGTGKNNTIQGMTFDLSGGVGLYITSDNINIGGNFFNGNGTAANAINLNSVGGNRVVTGNSAVDFTGAALINPTSTDIICGNNFLGCNSATANSGILEYKSSVNFNSANTDTAFSITLPPGITRYSVSSVRISGASASLTTATAGVFTAPAAGGVAIVTAASAITVSTAADATNNNAMSMNVNNFATTTYTAGTLYFRVANPQGSAATGTVTVSVIPVS